ncbi:unnamed protein product, partial [Owenia fusiformis]
IEIGMMEDVTITHCKDPEHFHAQLVSSQEELFQLMDDIEAYCSALSPGEGMMTAFGIGLPCLAKYSVDNGWYRAQIVAGGPNNTIEIEFVDYGNGEVVPKEDLRMITKEFLELPIQSIYCSLNDVKSYDDEWPQSEIKLFQETFMDSGLTYKALFDSRNEIEEIYRVELFQESDGSNMNEVFGGQTKRLPKNRPHIAMPAIQPFPSPGKLSTARSKAQQTQQSKPVGTSAVRSQEAPRMPTSAPREPPPPASGSNSQWQTWQESTHETMGREPPSEPAGRFSQHDLREGGSEPRRARSSTPLETGNIKLQAVSVACGKFLDLSVVYIDTPNSFYCQLTENAQQIDVMLEELHAEYEAMSYLQHSIDRPTVNMICCAKYTQDGTWYRASITAASSKEVEVFFVDYGNTDTVPYDNIKQLLPKYAKLQMQALKCSLNNVKPIGQNWTDVEIKAFEDLVNEKSLVGSVISKSPNGDLQIELLDSTGSNDIIINKELVLMGKAMAINTPPPSVRSGSARGASARSNSVASVSSVSSGSGSKASGRQAPVVAPPAPLGSNKASTNAKFKNIDVPEGSTKKIAITWTNNPHDFYCQLFDNEHVINSVMGKVHKTYAKMGFEENTLMNSEPGMACITKYFQDEAWYRATILDKTYNKEAKVLFIDYGNSEKVHVSILKEVQPEFLDVPAQAIKCKLHGVEPVGAKWGADAKGAFEKAAAQSSICTFMKKEGDTYIVELKGYRKMDVAEALIERGIARSSGGDDGFTPGFGAGRGGMGGGDRRGSSSDGRASRDKTPVGGYGSGAGFGGGAGFGSGAKGGFSASRGGAGDAQGGFGGSQSVVSKSAPINEWEAPSASVTPTQTGTFTNIDAKKFENKTILLTVTSIESPDDFYCQMNDHFTSIDNMMAKLDEYYKGQGQSEDSASCNKVGATCAAKFSEDQAYYRAKVIQCLPNRQVKVLFVDYGNSETVSLTDTKPLTQAFTKLPIQALQCSLSDQVTTYPQVAIDKFEQLAGGAEFSATILSVQGSKVYVQLNEGAKDINEEILNLVPGESKTKSKSAVKSQIAKFPPVSVKVGDIADVYVTHVESPSLMFIQLATIEDTLNSVMEELETKYMNLGPEDEALDNVEIGQACAALYSSDGAWYRAKVTKVSGSKATVCFVDYGNSEEVAKDSLKCLEGNLLTTPPCAIPCNLQTSEPQGVWGTDICTKLQDMLPAEKLLNYKVLCVGEVNTIQLNEGSLDIVEMLGLTSKVEEVRSTSVPSRPSPEAVLSYPTLQIKNGTKELCYVSFGLGPDDFVVQLSRDTNA